MPLGLGLWFRYLVLCRTHWYTLAGPTLILLQGSAGNAHRELARAHERVHDATTLQTCTTEYRYNLLGHHRLLVPDASRSGAQGRAAPARRFSLTPNHPANLYSRTYSGAGAVARGDKDYRG